MQLRDKTEMQTDACPYRSFPPFHANLRKRQETARLGVCPLPRKDRSDGLIRLYVKTATLRSLLRVIWPVTRVLVIIHTKRLVLNGILEVIKSIALHNAGSVTKN